MTKLLGVRYGAKYTKIRRLFIGRLQCLFFKTIDYIFSDAAPRKIPMRDIGRAPARAAGPEAGTLLVPRRDQHAGLRERSSSARGARPAAHDRSRRRRARGPRRRSEREPPVLGLSIG